MDRQTDGMPEGWMSGGKERRKGARMGIDSDYLKDLAWTQYIANVQ